MSCDELVRHLAEYEDGVLSEDLCGLLERHFRDCAPCAELRWDLEALQALCRQGPSPAMPEGLRGRLRGLLGGKG